MKDNKKKSEKKLDSKEYCIEKVKNIVGEEWDILTESQKEKLVERWCILTIFR